LDSPITPPNTIHTTGPFSTAVNALGGSPQISNGDTLQFRLEASAEMGASTGGEATGEVVYLTVPSASVSPLGTPTITPSVAIQETNQHVITTVTPTPTTTTTTTTLPPFNSIMSITETDGYDAGDEAYGAYDITFSPAIPVGYSVDVTIAYHSDAFSTGPPPNAGGTIIINKNGSQDLYHSFDEGDPTLNANEIVNIGNGDTLEVLLDVSVVLTGNLGEEAEANASFEVTVATISPAGTITIPASQNQNKTAAGAN